MPSFEILPFIQCHHTRGWAALGGETKPCNKVLGLACCALVVMAKETKSEIKITSEILEVAVT